jgi:hypothetical protein
MRKVIEWKSSSQTNDDGYVEVLTGGYEKAKIIYVLQVINNHMINFRFI